MALNKLNVNMLGFQNGFNEQKFTASEGQTVFTLANGSYLTGKNRMDVYVQGVKQPPDAFTETNTTTVTLSEGMSAGTIVELKWYESVLPATGGHAANHKRGGVDQLAATDIFGATVVVNVKDFGAVGNGVADDTTAIQNAINSAGTDGKGEVYVPPGTYCISAGLDFSPFVNKKCAFVMAKGSKLVATAAMSYMINLTPSTTGQVEACKFVFDQLDGQDFAVFVIRLRGVVDSEIRVDVLQNGTSGFVSDMSGDPAYGNFNNRIYINKIVSCTNYGFYCIGNQGTNFTDFQGNYVSIMQIIQCGHTGVRLNDNTTNRSWYNTFDLGAVEENTQYGIYLYSGRNQFRVQSTNNNGVKGVGGANGVDKVILQGYFEDGIDQNIKANHDVFDLSKPGKTKSTFDVKDYGAKGDGVTDDTQAFKDAISACASVGGGVVFVPKGKHIITDTLIISSSISFLGAGSDSTNMDNQTALTKSVSAIVWNGVTSSAKPVISITGVVGGISWKDIVIDGNQKAYYGVLVDQMRNSTWSNVKILRCTENGLRMVPIDGGVADSNTMFNVFTNLAILRCKTPLWMDGTGISNCCHNTFVNTQIDYGDVGMTGGWGIYMGDTDNNAFMTTYTYQRNGGGTAVMFAATSRANYFYHFEGTTYSTAGSKNSVFGYDRENGQARPVVEAGAELFWTETGNNAWAWNLTKMLEGFSVHLTGDNGATPTTGFQPSTKDVKFSRADNGMRYLFDLYDAGAGVRTKRDWISTDGTGPYQYSSINNQGYSWFKMDNNTSGKGLLKMYKDRAPVINELVAGRTQWEVGDMVYNNVPASGKPTGWVCVTAGNPGTWQAFGVLDGGINSLQTAVRYYRATAFSVPTTATIIPYDTKVFDTLNEFNKAGSLNRFTAASAGVYEVSASMYFSSVAASVRGELWLYKNAAADCRIATFTNSTAAFQQQVSGKCLVQLAANDIIDVRGLMTTATSTVADATGTTIHITRIS